MSKNRNLKKYIGLVGILFLFPLLWIFLFGMHSKHHFATLPYFGPDSTTAQSYTIPSFSFINQNGEVFTSDSLKGKVWLAAFYSTNDEHVAKITERLLNMNFRYRDESDIAIVCFSTDCNHDLPDTTKRYVEQTVKYNGFPGKWQFLTGNQDSMMHFLHTGFFIKDLNNEAIFRLIDNEGHVRGLYGNTEYHMRDAMEDVALLKKEIDQKRYDARHANDKH
jgi:protein SCO1/2